MLLTEITEESLKHLINSRSLLASFEQAQRELKQFRGSMFWVGKSGREYLIRTSSAGKQTSLGARKPENEAVFARWTLDKEMARERLKGLEKRLREQEKLNRVYGVGRAPDVMVRILSRLSETNLLKNFLVIGTNALHAYEAAAGIMFPERALETVDVDILWNTRRRVSFYTSLQRVGGSVLGLLQSVDPTFRKKEDQPYTAVNSRGFEVDIIRRDPSWGDPELLSLSMVEDDLIAARASQAGKILSAPVFESIVVATSGRIARIRTIAPADFVRFKNWLADRPERDPLKRRRDLLQARLVSELVTEYLPQSSPGAG